jgi:hypothetical protein
MTLSRLVEEWQEQGVGEHWSVAPLGGQVACVLKKGTLIHLEAEKGIFLSNGFAVESSSV